MSRIHPPELLVFQHGVSSGLQLGRCSGAVLRISSQGCLPRALHGGISWQKGVGWQIIHRQGQWKALTLSLQPGVQQGSRGEEGCLLAKL